MMRKKIMTLTLSVTMLLSTIVSTSALEKLDRIQGKNNYETAAKIADEKNFSSIVLVNMDNSTADGLSAAALAGCKNGVILLTKKDTIPSETKSKLHEVTNIYLIGKENAISKSVEGDLEKMGKNVTRIGGEDRYETSYKVAKEVLNTEGGLNKIFIANGVKGEADIVSASPVSYRDKSPILLTNGTNLKNNLKEIANTAANRYIVGGTAVVKDSVKNGLKNSERISGNNRYETNQKIVQKFYSNPKEFNIVDSVDYKIATVSSSISTEKPIALVEYRKDPLVLKNAQKITAIGNISDNNIAKAIGYSGGLNRFKYDWTKNKYIAHALGGIDGKTYTNSPQALEHSYNRGFKTFEVDLYFTSDDELVAWHSFDKNSLKEMGLPEKYSLNRPTLSEFKSMKSYGKYNTMSFKDIVKYMEKYKDIYMIIDLKTPDTENVRNIYKRILEEASPDVLNRLIPQIYKESNYNDIMNIYDFKSAAFTCYTMDKVDENWLTNYCALNGIKVITVDYRYLTPSLVEKCRSKGITLYMNTINNQNDANKYKSQGVYGFFTDFLTP